MDLLQTHMLHHPLKLLFIRYIFGFTSDTLASDAIGHGAMRTNAEDFEAYIFERMPE